MGVRSAAAFASHRFVVRQDRVGMKVGIDGIVLAAAAARAGLAKAQGASHGGSSIRVLDIGCGCGIVALLLRQAASFTGQPAHITAIDIDEAAAKQAQENVAKSPWPADIDVQQCSFQDFVSMSDGAAKSFDLVITNPPYFPRPPRHVQSHSAANRANQMQRLDRDVQAAEDDVWPQSRAHARFREYLPPLDLVRGAATLLAPHGTFFCVYPASEHQLLLEAAQAAGLQQRSRLDIRFKADLPVARIVWSFDLGSRSLTTSSAREELVVRHDDKTYTNDFVNLTKMCYSKPLPTR